MADNATVFSHMTIATLGTKYASILAPFNNSNNGNGVNVVLEAHFCEASH